MIFIVSTQERKPAGAGAELSDLHLTCSLSAEQISDSDMDNPELNVEKLAAEMAGNTLMDETSVNDQTYQQIVAFLKTDKMNTFR